MAKPLPASVGQAVTLLQTCLADLGEVRARGMFGGYGIYLEDRIIALWDEGALYLKVDALTTPRFEAEGLPPFSYLKESGRVTVMSYRRVSDTWQTPEAMEPWARLAVEAAKRSAKPNKKR
ncbi:MAG: TfoX/Sxy family protein [Elstera sp.]